MCGFWCCLLDHFSRLERVQITCLRWGDKKPCTYERSAFFLDKVMLRLGKSDLDQNTNFSEENPRILTKTCCRYILTKPSRGKSNLDGYSKLTNQVLTKNMRNLQTFQRLAASLTEPVAGRSEYLNRTCTS